MDGRSWGLGGSRTVQPGEESGMGGMLGSLPSMGGGMGGAQAGASPVASRSFDKLSPGGGGMDVMGSLEEHAGAGSTYAGGYGGW